MKQGARRGQRTRSAVLLLSGVVGCDAARPAAPAAASGGTANVSAQPVAAGPVDAAPASADSASTIRLDAQPAAPRVLAADELRDGGRMAPLPAEHSPQRLPPVGADQPVPVAWPQKPIAYPTTQTP